MPALAQPTVTLPRSLPYNPTGAEAGAGAFWSNASETRCEDLATLAHDARNVLSGLMLYSELLAAPGVLNPPHGYCAKELQDMVGSAARLIDKMVAGAAPEPTTRLPGFAKEPALPTRTLVPMASVSMTDAAADLRRLQPLLAAVAGPAVRLSVATMPCAGRTTLAVEDLTRILVNLVRNAADAMPAGGGHIGITAQYGTASHSAPSSVVLSVSDDGPGIPEALRPHIFELGFTTHTESANWTTPPRRGLGLSIVRNLVEAAGGAVRVSASHTGGSRFEITLPISEMVTSGTYLLPPKVTNPADSPTNRCIECQ